jgi:hypothetical protein
MPQKRQASQCGFPMSLVSIILNIFSAIRQSPAAKPAQDYRWTALMVPILVFEI